MNKIQYFMNNIQYFMNKIQYFMNNIQYLIALVKKFQVNKLILESGTVKIGG